MKTKLFYGLAFVMAVVILASCEKKSVYDPNTAAKFEDMNIPEGFDWDALQNVALSVSSQSATVVSVYTDAAFTDLVAKLDVGAQPLVCNLSIPKGVNTLYIKYPKAAQQTGVIQAAIMSTKADSRSKTEVVIPDGVLDEYDNGADNTSHKNVIYYPAKNGRWGSVLFEDMWSETGDYDLNDVAVWYRINLDLKKNTINIELRLNALGGNYPYELGMQIDDLETGAIREVASSTSADSRGRYIWMEDAATALFHYKWNIPGYPGVFYNTEQGIAPEELENNIISYTVELKEGYDVADLSLYSFNFFIHRPDGREIHLRGYRPTAAFMNAYKRIVAENDHLNSDVYYCTKDGFVWGLKIPYGIDHAIERTQFNVAYKFFSQWVTSNGNDHKNWYQEQSGKEHRIDVGKNK